MNLLGYNNGNPIPWSQVSPINTTIFSYTINAEFISEFDGASFSACLELDSSYTTIITIPNTFGLYFLTLFPEEAAPDIYSAAYIQKSDEKLPARGSQSAIQIITNPVTNGQSRALSIILSDCKTATPNQIRLNGVCQDLPARNYCPINPLFGFCNCPNDVEPTNFSCLFCPENAPYFDETSNTCGPNCQQPKVPQSNPDDTSDFICTNCVPDYVYVPDDGCYSSCPDTAPFLSDGTCFETCPSSAPYQVGNTCYSSCPDDYPFINGTTCVSSCPDGSFILMNKCLTSCPSAFPDTDPNDAVFHNYCYCNGLPCGDSYDCFNTPSNCQCLTTPFEYCDEQNNLLSCTPPQVYSESLGKCVCPTSLEPCLGSETLCYNPKNQQCDYGSSPFVCNPGKNGFCECSPPAVYDSSTGLCTNCPAGQSTAGITCSCNNTCFVQADCLNNGECINSCCTGGS